MKTKLPYIVFSLCTNKSIFHNYCFVHLIYQTPVSINVFVPNNLGQSTHRERVIMRPWWSNWKFINPFIKTDKNLNHKSKSIYKKDMFLHDTLIAYHSGDCIRTPFSHNSLIMYLGKSERSPLNNKQTYIILPFHNSYWYDVSLTAY